MPKGKNKSDSELSTKGPSSKYHEVISILESNGYYLKVNLDSKLTSFHDLYEKFCPYNSSTRFVPKGLKYPEWFECLVPASETTLETIQNEILSDDSMLEFDPDTREFCLPLFIYRSGRSSEVTDFILGFENHKALMHKKQGGGTYHMGIAHSPESVKDAFLSGTVEGVYSYVPEVSWFSEEVQKLKFEDIITIFPPAEAEMIKLIIGRACVGRTGAVHPGKTEPLKHSFRKAGVVVGETGVGKSTILNGIREAMKYCGYTVSSMGDLSSRFNQGSVISSHLAYNDDLTQASLEKMLTAPSFKSIVTGGTEKVENKGTDAIEVVSNTVILANANDVRSEISYVLDSGAISRLALLSTYRKYEQQDMSEQIGRDIHPIANIKYLMEEYDVDEITLFTRVLRHCTDAFLEQVQSGANIHSKSEDLLPYFRFQTHKNSLECFIRFCFLAFAIRDMKGQGDYLPELTLGSLATILESTRFVMIDMKANNLRKNMKENWENQKRDLDHPYWAQRKMLISSIDKSYEVFNAHKTDKDLALATEHVFSALTLRDGFSMSKKMSHIVRTWEMVKGEKKGIYRLANDLMNTLPQEELDYITDKSKRCDANWIYGSKYDPKSL